MDFTIYLAIFGLSIIAAVQADGDSQVLSRRAEGEAIAKKRVGEAETEVIAIKARNEAEAIRAPDTPDVLVSGNSGGNGGGASEAILAMLLRDATKK